MQSEIAILQLNAFSLKELRPQVAIPSGCEALLSAVTSMFVSCLPINLLLANILVQAIIGRTVY